MTLRVTLYFWPWCPMQAVKTAKWDSKVKRKYGKESPPTHKWAQNCIVLPDFHGWNWAQPRSFQPILAVERPRIGYNDRSVGCQAERERLWEAGIRYVRMKVLNPIPEAPSLWLSTFPTRREGRRENKPFWGIGLKHSGCGSNKSRSVISADFCAG